MTSFYHTLYSTVFIIIYFFFRFNVIGILARGAAGRINFRNVLEVRQSNVSGCPDNTIEIVTPGRIYTIVPSGEDNSDVSFDRWMNELINAADVYGADYVEAQKAGKLFKSDAVSKCSVIFIS